jgi:hypothetical protein
MAGAKVRRIASWNDAASSTKLPWKNDWQNRPEGLESKPKRYRPAKSVTA